jgi:capsular polysaccharide biosynthesis protein
VTQARPGATNSHTSPARGAARDGFGASRHQQGDVPLGLVSLRALRAALRRRAWLVCAAAVVGLAASGCLFVAAPPAYQAATSVLIMNNPGLDAAGQMHGDVTLAQTLQVAAIALHKLGLHESVTSFAHSYTVAAPTDQLLQITASASSAGEAERRANALAAGFRQYRAELLRIEQQIEVPTLNKQISVLDDQLLDIGHQIAAESALPKSAQRHKKLSGMLAGQRAADATAGALKYDVANYPLVTLSMIKGTAVLDPAAPIPPSRKHIALVTAVGGLVAGLAVGLGVVLIGAVTSDRLRERRDIARALGAPITLTVGQVPTASWLTGRRALTASRVGDIPRLVAHLRSNLHDGDGTAVALAVVPVGNADIASLALVRLATECAREGTRVVLADLAEGTPAARLLRVTDPGIHVASGDSGRIVVAVPGPSDRLPAGPSRAARRDLSTRPDKALAAACASARLLLTIARLDPALGAEHLATWTTNVVVVVTAGQSAAASLKSTGEMIRLAGMRLVSAVLVGADKTDESLGTTPAVSGLRRRSRALGRRQSVSV